MMPTAGNEGATEGEVLQSGLGHEVETRSDRIKMLPKPDSEGAPYPGPRKRVKIPDF